MGASVHQGDPAGLIGAHRCEAAVDVATQQFEAVIELTTSELQEGVSDLHNAGLAGLKSKVLQDLVHLHQPIGSRDAEIKLIRAGQAAAVGGDKLEAEQAAIISARAEAEFTGRRIPAEPVGYTQAGSAAGPQAVAECVAMANIDITKYLVEIQLEARADLQQTPLARRSEAIRRLIHVLHRELEGACCHGTIKIQSAKADGVGANSGVIGQAADAPRLRIEAQPIGCLHLETESIADQSIVITEQGGEVKAQALSLTDGALLRQLAHLIRRSVESLIHHLKLQAGAGEETIAVCGTEGEADGLPAGKGRNTAEQAREGINPQPAGQVGVSFEIEAVVEAVTGILVAEQVRRQGDAELPLLSQQDQRQLLATPLRGVVDVLDAQGNGLNRVGPALITGFHL